MGRTVPTLRSQGSPRPKIFDPQPTRSLANPRKRELLSVGLSVPPQIPAFWKKEKPRPHHP